jgi:hypothetical protein
MGRSLSQFSIVDLSLAQCSTRMPGAPPKLTPASEREAARSLASPAAPGAELLATVCGGSAHGGSAMAQRSMVRTDFLRGGLVLKPRS